MNKQWLVVVCSAVAALACDALGPDCTESHLCRLQIESDTSWAGALGGTTSMSSYNGSGNGWIEYWGDVCYTLQKDTDAGYLRAHFQETDRGHAETTASFGVISGCNH